MSENIKSHKQNLNFHVLPLGGQEALDIWKSICAGHVICAGQKEPIYLRTDWTKPADAYGSWGYNKFSETSMIAATVINNI